jgi:hypothetical protein
MTLGNIHGDIQHQHNSGAWLLLAILPTSSFTETLLTLTSPQSPTKLFKNEAATLPGILKQRLFHACMKIVIAPLIPPQPSHKVLGPDRKVHMCMACLIGYISDMKEQCMIACVAAKSCPICCAQPHQDGTTI